MDAVYIAAAQANGKVQLFVLDDNGVGDPRDLFDHNGRIEEIHLVLSFDSDQAVVFWIESKNAKTDEIYGYVFDLES